MIDMFKPMLKAIILFAVMLVSCTHAKNSFEINERELIQIFNDESFRKDFIEEWEMNRCNQSEISKRYCYKDSIFQFEIFENKGYLLSINRLDFSDFEGFILELEKKYDSQNIKDLKGFNKHLGMYDITFGRHFKNSEYEITVIVANEPPYKVYSITVNRADQ